MYTLALWCFLFADDHSRVPLTVDLPEESEYINACYINVNYLSDRT